MESSLELNAYPEECEYSLEMVGEIDKKTGALTIFAPMVGLTEAVDVPEARNPLCQWTEFSPQCFHPATKTLDHLTPGIYIVREHPQHGVYLCQQPKRTSSILRLPDMKTEEIVEEVKNFWSKKDAYLLNGVLYRRGILMYGSPGGGKSSTIRLISEDCVDRGGVVIIMENPYQFTTAYQDFRKVQPDTPVVVVIEDIDAIVSQYNESAVLNLVDGVVRADNCVFLATTNYPENLGDRIINRPSRFDVRVEIPMPSANARRAFLVAQFERGKVVPDSGQIDQWVKDSVSFSIAHLLELYVGVVVLGKPYDGVMGGLKQMARRVSSSDSAKKVGF